MMFMILSHAIVVVFRLYVIPDPDYIPRCRISIDDLPPMPNGMWLSGIPP